MQIKFCTENQNYTSIISDGYRGKYNLKDSMWLIEKQTKYFNCNTPILKYVFPLDNVKF